MSNFNDVSAWVDTHLATNTDTSLVTKELLLELQAMADNENESLSKRAFHALTNYHRQDGMRALSAIRTNSHNEKNDQYMDNAFSIVILKSDPHSTDGIFVIIQIVPHRYVLKTIVRANSDYVVTNITHTFFSLFESSQTKNYMVTGSNNGDCQKEIFAVKHKHDNYENIDKALEAGGNKPFVITKPNGETYEP